MNVHFRDCGKVQLWLKLFIQCTIHSMHSSLKVKEHCWVNGDSVIATRCAAHWTLVRFGPVFKCTYGTWPFEGWLGTRGTWTVGVSGTATIDVDTIEIGIKSWWWIWRGRGLSRNRYRWWRWWWRTGSDGGLSFPIFLLFNCTFIPSTITLRKVVTWMMIRSNITCTSSRSCSRPGRNHERIGCVLTPCSCLRTTHNCSSWVRPWIFMVLLSVCAWYWLRLLLRMDNKWCGLMWRWWRRAPVPLALGTPNSLWPIQVGTSVTGPFVVWIQVMVHKSQLLLWFPSFHPDISRVKSWIMEREKKSVTNHCQHQQNSIFELGEKGTTSIQLQSLQKRCNLIFMGQRTKCERSWWWWERMMKEGRKECGWETLPHKCYGILLDWNPSLVDTWHIERLEANFRKYKHYRTISWALPDHHPYPELHFHDMDHPFV